MKQNNIALFLDDIRDPKDGYLHGEKTKLVDESGIPAGCWQVVRTYDQFVRFVKKYGVPKTISFDNDLDPSHYQVYMKAVQSGYFEWLFIQPKMGLHALDFLLKYCRTNHVQVPRIYIHTANHMARQEMVNMIQRFSEGGSSLGHAGLFLPK